MLAQLLCDGPSPIVVRHQHCRLVRLHGAVGLTFRADGTSTISIMAIIVIVIDVVFHIVIIIAFLVSIFIILTIVLYVLRSPQHKVRAKTGGDVMYIRIEN